jgi:hypothetical protein
MFYPDLPMLVNERMVNMTQYTNVGNDVGSDNESTMLRILVNPR